MDVLFVAASNWGDSGPWGGRNDVTLGDAGEDAQDDPREPRGCWSNICNSRTGFLGDRPHVAGFGLLAALLCESTAYFLMTLVPFLKFSSKVPSLIDSLVLRFVRVNEVN